MAESNPPPNADEFIRTRLPRPPKGVGAATRQRLMRQLYTPASDRAPEECLPDRRNIRILDQGHGPYSVGFAVAATLDYLRSESGVREPLSPYMIYEYAKLYDEWPGEDYDGTSVFGALAGISIHGVCLLKDWPAPRQELPDEPIMKAALENRPWLVRRIRKDREDLKAAVFEHHAIVVSVNTHDGWEKPREGVIPFEKSFAEQGGHAVCVIGYTPAGFIIQNSWGPEWAGAVVGGERIPGTAIWTYEDADHNLTDAWVLSVVRPPTSSIAVAGYDSDEAEGAHLDDLLEIQAEVDAFSYVLASRTTRPPMALGLFGEWGSGKSFFMQKMRARIDSLTREARESAAGSTNESQPPPFCSNVVQIRFNAWHYLDTDLWASLVTEIFDRLFEAIGGESDKPEAKLPMVAAQLHEANGVYRQAKQQLDDAKQARANAEEALATAVQQRAVEETKLSEQLDDLVRLIAGDQALQASVQGLARDLGVPQLSKSLEAVEERVSELTRAGNRTTALLQTVLSSPWRWWEMVLLGMALAAPVIIMGLIAWARAMGASWIDQAESHVLEISGFLTSVAAWIGWQIKRGMKLLSTLESTHRDLQRIREEKRRAALAQPTSRLQSVIETESAARASLQDAEQRVQALQREMDDLQPGRLIMRFIEERTRSTDYRSRLGIVSLVRRDFERLSELSDPDSGKADRELMPVERIVLYIDDLDRCKPDRVIEVLEAVHLLLSFRLFMVVVAVDPRWLAKCLEKHYPELLVVPRQTSDHGHVIPSRPATAQDYLEKIFQVPFSLQPMRGDGFRRMVRGLTKDNVVIEDTGSQQPRPRGSAAVKAEGRPAEAEQPGSAPSQSEENGTHGDKADGAPTPTPQHVLQRLQLRSWELRDLERLAPFFRTPRGVKRFINSYRFLRAGIRAHELPAFEGTVRNPGTYRSTLVLLSVVVNYPSVASRFLRLILDSKSSGAAPIRALFESGHRATEGEGGKPPRNGKPEWADIEWRQLCEALQEVSETEIAVPEIRELKPWVRTVARYSFSLSALGTLEE